MNDANVRANIDDARDTAIPAQDQWVATKRKARLSNGVELAYLDIGDPAGKPTMLVHGYCDTSRCWSTVAPFLQNRRLLIVDLRGHGGSTAPESCSFTMMEFAIDLSLLVSSLNVGRVDVVAHSMGAMVSQTLAATHPEQVDKLVLLAGSAMGHFRPTGWLWDNVMALVDPIDPNSAFMNELYHREIPVSPLELDILSKQEAARTSARVWKGMLTANVMTDLYHLDSMIRAPTLIMAAAKDHLITLEETDRLARAIPHAEKVIDHDLGHGLFKERPAEVGAVIAEFLDR